MVWLFTLQDAESNMAGLQVTSAGELTGIEELDAKGVKENEPIAECETYESYCLIIFSLLLCRPPINRETRSTSVRSTVLSVSASLL